MRARLALTFVSLLATLTIGCSSPTAPEPQGTLVIDAFEMLELYYPDSGEWSYSYAPRVHVTSTRDEWITVTMISASLGPPSFLFSPPGCPTAKRVAPNSSRDLFGSGYGDFETSYSKPGVRVPPGTTAHVVVTFIGETGTIGQATADTVVTSGTFPTYGESALSEPCGWPGQSVR